MLKKIMMTSITLSVFCTVLSVHPCFADDATQNTTINPTNSSTINVPLQHGSVESVNTVDLTQSTPQSSITTVKLSENDAFYHLVSATDRFIQCNIRAAWSDFRNLINGVPENDFVYLSIAQKMSGLGFFDLSNYAISKISDKDISRIPVDEMKRFYYPRKNLKLEDEIYLAGTYSNIIYNDQSSESTNELLKKSDLLSYSDYANYIAALGSYKSGFYSRANQYISIAIIQNPYNLNYLKLKAQIIADGKNPSDAIRIVNILKHQNLASTEYNRQINSLEQYVQYKIAKKSWEKSYHLGYYYYYENDASKGIRTLQTALSQARHNSQRAMIDGLMSEMYMSIDEFEKAGDAAKKSHRIDSNNSKALITLGDLSYRNCNYKQALKEYKQAASNDKYSYIPLVREAKAYQKLCNEKKARELYTKVLRNYSNSYEAYYNIALMNSKNPNDEIIYLDKSLAVNLQYKDAWIELARIEIGRENFDIAQKYLSNAYYIDENDYRYYYYQGLLDKNIGETTKADYNFKKCLKLNPKFTQAQQELSPDIN